MVKNPLYTPVFLVMKLQIEQSFMELQEQLLQMMEVLNVSKPYQVSEDQGISSLKLSKDML